MFEYTPIRKKPTTQTNIYYNDKNIDKLIELEQYNVALEYINDTIEANNNSYDIDHNLQEKLEFTKQHIVALISNTDNTTDIESLVDYLNSKISFNDAEKTIVELLNHNPSMVYRLLDYHGPIFNFDSLVKIIPKNYYDRKNIINLLYTYGEKIIYNIEIPDSFSDDAYVDIIFNIFKFHVEKNSSGDYMDIDMDEYLAVFSNVLNENIVNKLLDLIHTNYDASILNYDNNGLFYWDYLCEINCTWITYDIILKATKLGNPIHGLYSKYITKEIVLAAYKFNDNIYAQEGFFDAKWFDEMYLQDAMNISRKVLQMLSLPIDEINKLIIMYPDTIEYLKTVNYDMCYKAYKKHGDSCVKFMPENIAKLFKRKFHNS